MDVSRWRVAHDGVNPRKGHDSIPATERIFYEITNMNKENWKPAGK